MYCKIIKFLGFGKSLDTRHPSKKISEKKPEEQFEQKQNLQYLGRGLCFDIDNKMVLLNNDVLYENVLDFKMLDKNSPHFINLDDFYLLRQENKITFLDCQLEEAPYKKFINGYRVGDGDICLSNSFEIKDEIEFMKEILCVSEYISNSGRNILAKIDNFYYFSFDKMGKNIVKFYNLEGIGIPFEKSDTFYKVEYNSKVYTFPRDKRVSMSYSKLIEAYEQKQIKRIYKGENIFLYYGDIGNFLLNSKYIVLQSSKKICEFGDLFTVKSDLPGFYFNLYDGKGVKIRTLHVKDIIEELDRNLNPLEFMRRHSYYTKVEGDFIVCKWSLNNWREIYKGTELIESVVEGKVHMYPKGYKKTNLNEEGSVVKSLFKNYEGKVILESSNSLFVSDDVLVIKRKDNVSEIRFYYEFYDIESGNLLVYMPMEEEVRIMKVDYDRENKLIVVCLENGEQTSLKIK